MAYPALHLLVAAQAAAASALGSDGVYLLGAIAPDAIHARHGTGTSRGKRETHLHARGDGIAETEAYLAAYGRTPFHLGYAVHVLTDRLWAGFYVPAYPALMLPDGHTNPVVYAPDAEWIDRALAYEDLRRTGILALLEEAVPPDDHPLLTADEIGRWRDRYIRIYHAVDRMPEGAPVHMKLPQVKAFMDQAALALRRQFML